MIADVIIAGIITGLGTGLGAAIGSYFAQKGVIVHLEKLNASIAKMIKAPEKVEPNVPVRRKR